MSHTHEQCMEVISKVVLALDGELNENEEKNLYGELQQCSWCLEQYEIEKCFKSFLSKKIEKRCVSPECVANIKSRIKEGSIAE